MYVFINGTDRTANIIKNSLSISDELQERINSCSFSVSGFIPTAWHEVKVYDGFPIVSATSTTITIQKNYNTAVQNNLFRIGSIVYFAINLSDEEYGTVTAISDDGGNVKLTFSATFANTPIAGELAGVKKFAGIIPEFSDQNQSLLTNISYDIEALDFTRIFDKQLINDTYANKDARYIINDFCNVSVNYNQEIDSMDYANNTAIQAEWIESGDGSNPTIDTTNEREGTTCGNFSWVFSGGIATFSSTPTSMDSSDLTGVTSGTPTKGVIGVWVKATDYTKVTSIEIRIGSDSSNYTKVLYSPTSNEWVYVDKKLTQGTTVGTPVWTALDYCAIIVTETASSSILLDGIRILEEEFFRHYPYVQESSVFQDFRIPRVKPTEVMQRLAEELAWYWYIDYDRNIHLFTEETNISPFDIDETSNNFNDLSISYDATRLINRQTVKGADETSESTYSQVVQGDGVVKEWIMKSKFKNLVVKLDNNTSTDTCEAGTNTTTINATAHGLVAGDYIVNRTRSNAVREVLTVPSVDQFTVAAVTSQTNGDTFSKFIAQTVGVEGLNDDVGYDFMSNFNEKSIRNSETKAVLTSSDFLLFQYNEVFPIIVQRTDNTSVAAMKTSLGHTNGIFEGQPIVDRTIQTRAEATALAQAQITKYSNIVISASFKTTQEGLRSGQLINIKDTANGTRNIDQQFVIQKVVLKERAWGENQYAVTCSSLLFGIVELFQQLLKQGRKIEVQEDEVINNVEDANETLTITDAWVVEDQNVQSETLTISDSWTTSEYIPPFKWGVDANTLIWNLSSWG